MDIPTVNARPRNETGRRSCNRLRRDGFVPVVMYGRGKPNVMMTIEHNVLHGIVDAHTLVFNISDGSEQTPVQLLAVQYDHLGDEILHADLGRISMTEVVEVAVAVETKGDPVGVREDGGVLELILHELAVECLPGNIPESVVVDVAHLRIGDDIRVGDLQLPDGVTALDEEESVVVTCAPPTEMVTEEDEEALVEDVMAEPELIGRDREEDEEAVEEEED